MNIHPSHIGFTVALDHAQELPAVTLVYIYIPRKPGTRHAWGQETDYKAELKLRNDRIRSDYAAGASVTALSRKYHLSEKSIRRILQNQ